MKSYTCKSIAQATRLVQKAARLGIKAKQGTAFNLSRYQVGARGKIHISLTRDVIFEKEISLARIITLLNS